ncbi:MAG: polysulfide reductase NrfD [Deltaproteobacteria bacterium]|nr:polysulfide reductase NrfD [Deltaproteobacteria bacterium]
MEFTITGANALTYPHLQIWGWQIAIYLFLGGLAGGCMSMSAVANLRPGKEAPHNKPCCWRIPVITPFILALGMGFLFLDLSCKRHIYRFYMTLRPLSIMSWGSWILILVFPAMIAFALSTVPDAVMDRMHEGAIKNLCAKFRPHMRTWAAVNFVLGLILSVYTGVLLSMYMARPLWNSSILPILFLTSGMSTGAALVIVLAKKDSVKLFFTRVDIWLIIFEAAVLALFYFSHYMSAAASRESVMPLFTMSSRYFPYFVTILTLSIILPLFLVLKFLDATGKHSRGVVLTFRQKCEMNASAILVLLGGVILRFELVYAGQLGKLTGLS